MAVVSGLGEVRVNAAFFRRFNYSSALVHSCLFICRIFINLREHSCEMKIEGMQAPISPNLVDFLTLQFS